MADHERGFVDKVAQTGSIERMMGEGLDATHLLDPELRDVWDFMVEHVRKYRSAPSLPTIQQRFPAHVFEAASEPLDFLRDETIKGAKYRAACDALRDIAKAVEDPATVGKIEEYFLEHARRFAQLVPGNRVSRFSNMEQRIQAYRDRQASGQLPGIPMGIPSFDRMTLGIQQHEFVSIVGWQGTGKSTLLQFVFFNAYLAGHTPLLISLEMEQEALYRKWDTMALHFQYHALKAMELPDADIEKWEEMADRAKNATNDILVIDDVGRCTVDRVYAEAVKYGPDLVGVDYVSLMEVGRSVEQHWQQITVITQQLKMCARGLKIPHFGVAQTNIDSADEGAMLKNIAYSRSIGQDSDLVFGLHQTPRMEEDKQMEVRMLKNRDGQRKTAQMHWDPEHMEFEEIGAHNLFKKRPGQQKEDDMVEMEKTT